jgi:hypothetical protein
MLVLSEKRLIQIMKNSYRARLLEAMSESDVIDARGNVVIQQDLKVRHKKTQYEYTVDHVEGEGDDVRIALRLPDEPRFEPPPESEEILDSQQDQLLGEQDPFVGHAQNLALKGPSMQLVHSSEPAAEDGDDIFIIDKEEFEKEYEVK